MSALQAIEAARTAGVRLGVKGNSLLLEADHEPPTGLLERLKRHKFEVLALLRSAQGDWSEVDWRAFFDERVGIAEYDGGMNRQHAEALAFECCVTEWLDHHPAPSPAGQCAWCERAEVPTSVVVPFGTEPDHHTWLHPECWSDWSTKRRSEAVAVLQAMGICCSADPKEAPQP